MNLHSKLHGLTRDIICYIKVFIYFKNILNDIPYLIINIFSASTLVQLSTDLDICKQLFSYGAIKPILNVTDASVTNDACMLAGLGCIIQLCKSVLIISL